MHDQSNILKSVPRKPSLPAARPARRQVQEYSESDREESEYESDGEDIERSPAHTREDEPDHEDEYEEDEADEEALGANSSSEEDEDEVRHAFPNLDLLFPLLSLITLDLFMKQPTYDA